MSVDHLITEAVPILADEVFAIAKRLRTSSPMFRLKFWYYDNHAPCCYFLAHGLTVPERDIIGKRDSAHLWEALLIGCFRPRRFLNSLESRPEF